MTVRVGINGFGRIGRNFFRAAKQRGVDLDIVAVNDLGSLDTMAHLLKYDSVLGVLPQTIKATKGGISVDGDELKVLSYRNPAELPWGELGVDVVIESTGIFTKRDTAAAHLDAGAPLVIVSAPCDGADATFVYGVNHKDFDPKVQKVISNASCTTNCFVPMVKVLDDAFGVEQGLMQTVTPLFRQSKGTSDAPFRQSRQTASLLRCQVRSFLCQNPIDIPVSQPVHRQYPTARSNGRQQQAGLMADQQQQRCFRWLFKNFQQGIGSIDI